MLSGYSLDWIKRRFSIVLREVAISVRKREKEKVMKKCFVNVITVVALLSSCSLSARQARSRKPRRARNDRHYQTDKYQLGAHYKDKFRNLPRLETKHLILRKLDPVKDVEPLFELFSDKDVATFLPWSVDKTIEGTRKRLRKHANDIKNGQPFPWVIELKSDKVKSDSPADGTRGVSQPDTNAVIGYLGFTQINFLQKIGVLLGGLRKKYWRKGYVIEAGNAILKYGFEKLEFRKIYTFVDIDNEGTKIIHERVGFKQEDIVTRQFPKDRQQRKLYLYAITRDEYAKLRKAVFGEGKDKKEDKDTESIKMILKELRSQKIEQQETENKSVS